MMAESNMYGHLMQNKKKKKALRKVISGRGIKKNISNSSYSLSQSLITTKAIYKKRLKSLLLNNMILAKTLEHTQCDFVEKENIIADLQRKLHHQTIIRIKLKEMADTANQLVSNLAEIIDYFDSDSPVIPAEMSQYNILPRNCFAEGLGRETTGCGDKSSQFIKDREINPNVLEKREKGHANVCAPSNAHALEVSMMEVHTRKIQKNADICNLTPIDETSITDPCLPELLFVEDDLRCDNDLEDKTELSNPAGSFHLKTPELKTPELKTPELKTPELKTPELKTPELKIPEFKSKELKTPELSVASIHVATKTLGKISKGKNLQSSTQKVRFHETSSNMAIRTPTSLINGSKIHGRTMHVSGTIKGKKRPEKNNSKCDKKGRNNFNYVGMVENNSDLTDTMEKPAYEKVDPNRLYTYTINAATKTVGEDINENKRSGLFVVSNTEKPVENSVYEKSKKNAVIVSDISETMGKNTCINSPHFVQDTAKINEVIYDLTETCGNKIAFASNASPLPLPYDETVHLHEDMELTEILDVAAISISNCSGSSAKNPEHVISNIEDKSSHSSEIQNVVQETMSKGGMTNCISSCDENECIDVRNVENNVQRSINSEKITSKLGEIKKASDKVESFRSLRNSGQKKSTPKRTSARLRIQPNVKNLVIQLSPDSESEINFSFTSDNSKKSLLPSEIKYPDKSEPYIQHGCKGKKFFSSGNRKHELLKRNLISLKKKTTKKLVPSTKKVSTMTNLSPANTPRKSEINHEGIKKSDKIIKSKSGNVPASNFKRKRVNESTKPIGNSDVDAKQNHSNRSLSPVELNFVNTKVPKNNFITLHDTQLTQGQDEMNSDNVDNTTSISNQKSSNTLENYERIMEKTDEEIISCRTFVVCAEINKQVDPLLADTADGKSKAMNTLQNKLPMVILKDTFASLKHVVVENICGDGINKMSEDTNNFNPVLSKNVVHENGTRFVPSSAQKDLSNLNCEALPSKKLVCDPLCSKTSEATILINEMQNCVTETQRRRSKTVTSYKEQPLNKKLRR